MCKSNIYLSHLCPSPAYLTLYPVTAQYLTYTSIHRAKGFSLPLSSKNLHTKASHLHRNLPSTMSSGSTFRNHCEQIASLLRAQISESTPTTIYNALQELQSNRDKLAAATGTGGSDLSLSDIIEQAVSDLNERSSLLNERNSLKAENQRLRDECITLRTLCRGLQETNGRLERGVNRLHREQSIVNDVLAGGLLEMGESRPETLLGSESLCSSKYSIHRLTYYQYRPCTDHHRRATKLEDSRERNSQTRRASAEGGREANRESPRRQGLGRGRSILLR